jgi:Kef-type K+ transport system membrane component KefB
VPIALAAEPHSLSFVGFLVALLSILLGAKLLGELAARLGQPAVLGELVAGLILGPHALGLVPDHAFLHLLAGFGVLLLLFEIGLETDLDQLLRAGQPALRVALAGVVLPYLGGHLFAAALGLEGLAPVIVGATLTATSVGITARVLADLGRLSTPEANIILGAAVVDDILGIVILSLVERIGEAGRVSAGVVAWSLIAAFGFLALALLAGRWLAPALVALVGRMRARGSLIVYSLAFALALGALADFSGSAPLIGALAAGLLLARTHRGPEIEEQIRPVADVFTPVFFVSVGAAVDLGRLSPLRAENFPTLALAAGLVVVAVLGKLAAGFVAGRVNRLAVGAGMVPRGEVGLIFAGVGLGTGALDASLFGALVAVVLVTTFATPPLLRRLFQRETGRGGAPPDRVAGAPPRGVDSWRPPAAGGEPRPEP